jgi:hypothetical protein
VAGEPWRFVPRRSELRAKKITITITITITTRAAVGDAVTTLRNTLVNTMRYLFFIPRKSGCRMRGAQNGFTCLDKRRNYPPGRLKHRNVPDH